MNPVMLRNLTYDEFIDHLYKGLVGATITEDFVNLIDDYLWKAKEEGLDEGTSKGYEEGYDRGREDGYYAGYQEGHSVGYDSGYIEGTP